MPSDNHIAYLGRGTGKSLFGRFASQIFRSLSAWDGSFAVLAVRFGVSQGWAEKLMRDLRRTGRIERPQGEKRGAAMNADW